MRGLLFRTTVVFEANSPISGSIAVTDRGWERVLSINGERHSVYFKRFGWSEAQREYWGLLASPVFNRTAGADILMLGLGGGTTLHLMQRHSAPASVTVVEHDPEVIATAKSYFGIDAISGLDIISGGAIDAMRKMRTEQKTFDLLIDDVFFDLASVDGDPGKAIFMTMKSLLRPGGTMILNRPIDGPDDEVAHARFIDQLKRLGHEVASKTVRERGWNTIIYCRRQTS